MRVSWSSPVYLHNVFSLYIVIILLVLLLLIFFVVYYESLWEYWEKIFLWNIFFKFINLSDICFDVWLLLFNFFCSCKKFFIITFNFIIVGSLLRVTSTFFLFFKDNWMNMNYRCMGIILEKHCVWTYSNMSFTIEELFGQFFCHSIFCCCAFVY